MKKSGIEQLLIGLTFCVVSLIYIGCQNKDVDVKADIATKAEQDPNFAGVRFTVENGTVNLSGDCATDKARSTVESTVKGVYGVNKVMDNIKIAAVVIGTDEELKQSVDSVLEKYAGAQALVKDSVVVLEGQVKKNDLQKLTAAISKLQPKKLESYLSIKQKE